MRSYLASDAERLLIDGMLVAPSPDSWVTAALQDVDTLLLDHAECEKKAASNAFSLMYRYGAESVLVEAASRFAREELRHFEMVQAFMRGRGVSYRSVGASRYAGGLKRHVRTSEPGRLVDTLLVAAVIEARSLERFLRIVTATDDAALAQFYGKLRASEARHARTYLALAGRYADRKTIDARLDVLKVEEHLLIDSVDTELRFHSGRPAWLSGPDSDADAPVARADKDSCRL